MKDNLIYHPEEIKRLNRMNILMRLLDEICTEGQAKPKTFEEWQKVKNED